MTIQLNFLTEDSQKIEACTDYWLQEEGDKGFIISAREASNTHNLKYNGLAKQISEWCQAYSLDDSCAQCQERYWVYSSRSEYQQRLSSHPNWICRSCQEENRVAEYEREQQQREEVREYFEDENRGNVSFRGNDSQAHNTLEEIVALLSLIRLSATEELSHIAPMAEIGDQKLSPTRDYDVQLIRMLVQNGILRPNVEHSFSEAFIFEEGKFTGTYYLYHVAWDFPVIVSTDNSSTISDSSALIETLEQTFLNMEWPEAWNDQWVPLWRKIALEECLQYLNLCMNEHGFDFSPGEKTQQVLTSALNSYSVAQVYNFIWGASRDAAAYYMRENIPRKRAANSAVGSIQRKAERARAEGWDVKAFGRDRRCPRTMMSQVLFDTVLHIGEEGFTQPPASS